LAHIFPAPASSIRDRKKINHEGRDYLQKTCHNIGQKLTNYKHLAEKQIEDVLRPCKQHFVVTMKNTT